MLPLSQAQYPCGPAACTYGDTYLCSSKVGGQAVLPLLLNFLLHPYLFLKAESSKLLVTFPSQHQLFLRGQAQFVPVGTCWASATAVAERKCGQMALGRISCLSMAGSSSAFCGASGRAGHCQILRSVLLIAPARNNIWSLVLAESVGQEMAEGLPLPLEACLVLLAGTSWNTTQQSALECPKEGIPQSAQKAVKSSGNQKNTEALLCPT